jgi:hypothetical protein
MEKFILLRSSGYFTPIAESEIVKKIKKIAEVKPARGKIIPNSTTIIDCKIEAGANGTQIDITVIGYEGTTIEKTVKTVRYIKSKTDMTALFLSAIANIDFGFLQLNLKTEDIEKQKNKQLLHSLKLQFAELDDENKIIFRDFCIKNT